MQPNPIIKSLLLFTFVLLLYHATTGAELISIDDPHIVATYGLNSTSTLKSILLPGNGFYYRPLIELSYYLDGILWDMEPSFLHLENVIIHAVNVVLVYWLALTVAALTNVAYSGWPFWAALIFAVHPVNSEAVVWYAGRTDPLAATFVLLGCLLALRWKLSESKSWSRLILALVVGAVGLLAKETAIVFFPAILLLLTVHSSFVPLGSLPLRTKVAAGIGITVVVTFILIYAFSGGVVSHALGKIAGMLSGDRTPVFGPAMASLGFYVKKLFFPLPLNFAINNVGSGYGWLGAAAVVGAPLLLRRNVPCRLLAVALLFLCPALLIAVYRITWTPVAERYLYLPSAFFVIGIVALGASLAAQQARKQLFVIFACLLVGWFSMATYARTIVWHDSLSLLRDTVPKSPDFGDLRNDLAIQLARAGRLAEAKTELRLAGSLPHNPHIDHLIRLNDLGFKLRGKNSREALSILKVALPDPRKAADEELLMLRNALEGCLFASKTVPEQRSISSEIITVNDLLYERNRDGYLLYRNGLLTLSIGNRERAAQYFAQAFTTAADGATYKAAAQALAKRLGREHAVK